MSIYDRLALHGAALPFLKDIQAQVLLLGASDIQSLADMASSYQIVQEMRPIPFSNRVAIGVLVSFRLLIAPLLLTVIPLEEVARKLIRAFMG